MNLFTNIRTKYGQDTVKDIRRTEALEKKLARNRNHLVFSLRCKEEGLTPASLNLKCPIRTQKAQDIISKAKRGLLCERIRVCVGTIKGLRNNIDIQTDNVVNKLHADDADTVRSHFRVSREREFETTKRRHCTKLDRLLRHKKLRNTLQQEPDLTCSQLKK